jgi:pilus assembly protein CpaF
MLNLILIVALIGLLALVLFGMFKKTDDIQEDDLVDNFTIDGITETTKDIFSNLLKTDIDSLGLDQNGTLKAEQNKAKLRSALKTCFLGDIGSKEYLKERIKDILQKKFNVNEENINQLVPFDSPKALSPTYKFFILLEVYKKEYKLKAFEQIVKKYNLLDDKYDSEGNAYYEISNKDIEYVYKKENPHLDFNMKLTIIAQLVYQNYKGNGNIDELRDMAIDGISAGVSGIPETMYSYGEDLAENKEDPNKPLTAYNSIWIMMSGKNIRMAFLGFGSQNELIRVCKNVYRHDNPGQLSAAKGCIANKMFDGSRVLTFRPKFAESWGFFIRKFGAAGRLPINVLINGFQNELAIQSLRWVVRGCQNLIITGVQGSGKTTMLGSLIQFVSRKLNIRVNEKMAELALRKAYPKRNIMSMEETPEISIQMGIDLSKKMDGDIGIMGEAAADSDCNKVVQNGRVGYRMVLATHHAKSAREMVLAFRDSISRTDGGDLQVLERDVAAVLHFNLDCTREPDGFRHITRLTEVIALDAEPYPEELDEATKQYYQRTTDRPLFITRDIFHWDYELRGFVFDNMISERAIKEITSNLQTNEMPLFNQFLNDLNKCIVDNKQYQKES